MTITITPITAADLACMTGTTTAAGRYQRAYTEQDGTIPGCRDFWCPDGECRTLNLKRLAKEATAHAVTRTAARAAEIMLQG